MTVKDAEHKKTNIMIKKVLSVIAVSTLMLGAVIAQPGNQKFDNKSPDEIAKMKTERMTSRLSLTDSQSEDVHSILLESATKRSEIQEQYPQLKEAKAEMKSYRKDNKAKVHEILTEEQISKQQALRKGSGNKMKKGHGKRNGDFDTGARLEQMQTDLDLTDQQVAQLKLVFENAKTHRAEVQAKYPELEEAREEMQKNKANTDQQLKTVLTAEQYKMYQERGPKKNCNGNKGNKGNKGMR